MASEFNSHSDDDEEVVVLKRKRNVVLDDESEDEATIDRPISNQTNKSNLNNEAGSDNDDPVNDNSIAVSSKIETLPEDRVDKHDSDNDSVSDNSIVNDDESNHSESISKNSDNENPKEKKYTFDPSIYDAEESDEETRSKTPEPTFEEERPHDEVKDNLPKSKKTMAKDKSSKQQNKSKKEKPGENMREIRRESQRLLRESKIILPYHVPKQRTLAEFLNRRKTAPSIPMRTTTEQLITLSKQIEQLEKESQEFFKSDSSDNDADSNDEDYAPDKENNSKSLQDDKIQINDNDDKTDKDKLDENFNKEKVTDDGDGLSAKINKNVANLLMDVAQRLENVVEKSSEEATSKNDENSQSSLKITTDETQLSELSIHKNDENTVQNPFQKSSQILPRSIDEVSSGAKSTSHPDKDDESDCDDFTLNLTMPEDVENVGQQEKEDSFTLDLTMPEDSANIEEDKLKDSKESSSLKLKVPGDDENTVEDKEKSNEEESTLNLKMLEDDKDIVEDEEKNNEETMTLNLTMPEDSDNILEGEEKNNEESLNLTMPEDSETISDSKEHVSKDDKSCKLKKIELLSKIHVDLTKVPTLSKSFGGEINLDSPPKKAGMIDLKERFFKHYAMDRKKKKSKSPAKVSVVRAIVDDKGHVEDISHEVIGASNKPDEQWLEEIKEAELPGAKHSKLKEFLQSKAKAKWKEEYEKRLQEYKLNEEETVEGDKADYEHEAILDDEDEEEDMTNSEEEEEEPEENDVELVDKKRKQSKFVEDEADVSEDEDGDLDSVEEEVEEVGEENEDILLGYNESDDDDDEDSEKRDRRKKKKTKKRKATSDEDIDSENEEELDSEIEKRKRKLMASDGEESDDDELSPKRKLMSSDNEDASQSMEDLAGLCSGKFPTQPVSFSQLENADADNLLKGFADGESQSLDLSLPEQSQALDRSRDDSDEEGDTKRTQKSILDSDNEEEDDEIVLNRSQKKRAKAVEYSDDEDEKPKPEVQTDEDEEVRSENSEELVLDEIGNEDVELEYDSEENEVIRDPKAFFEKEAELSESEWGSEDEDEKDLDKFEEEAGDQEVLDEDEVNRELGKIHMQQMLVDDKRDVRILQELLLEDGELHSDGSGRQRQFRWANADSGFAEGDPNTKDSDEDDSDQEEDEENWRKKRHERELFLNKKNERMKELGIEEEDDEEEEEEGGGLLGMGRALVKRMQTTTATKPPTTITSKASAAAVAMNCKFMAKNMRGSFLTSSEQYLTRLAHITTKVGSEGNVNGPKNSRNFVFSIVSPKKEEVKEDVPEETNKVKKRKATENAANAKKKTHFSDDKGNDKRKSLLEVLG